MWGQGSGDLQWERQSHETDDQSWGAGWPEISEFHDCRRSFDRKLGSTISRLQSVFQLFFLDIYKTKQSWTRKIVSLIDRVASKQLSYLNSMIAYANWRDRLLLPGYSLFSNCFWIFTKQSWTRKIVSWINRVASNWTRISWKWWMRFPSTLLLQGEEWKKCISHSFTSDCSLWFLL